MVKMALLILLLENEVPLKCFFCFDAVLLVSCKCVWLVGFVLASTSRGSFVLCSFLL